MEPIAMGHCSSTRRSRKRTKWPVTGRVHPHLHLCHRSNDDLFSHRLSYCIFSCTTRRQATTVTAHADHHAVLGQLSHAHVVVGQPLKPKRFI